MSEEKEDPDDVIYEGGGVIMHSPLSYLKKYRVEFNKVIEDNIYKLDIYIEKIKNNEVEYDQSIIDNYKKMIVIYSKLVFILNKFDMHPKNIKRTENAIDAIHSEECNFDKLEKNLDKIIETSKGYHCGIYH